MKKSFALVLIACMMCTVSFVGCGKKADDGVVNIRVAFWGSPEEKKIITSSVAEWETAHPEIKVVFEHTPAGGYVQKMLTRIAGGAAPDIMCVRVDQFVNFAKRNVLMNISPMIEQDASFDITTYFPEVVDNFSAGGSVYAIPRDTAPYACIFYNKEVFDSRGVAYPTDDWTWADMLEKAQALSFEDERGRKHFGYYGWSWENYVYSNGGALVDNVKHPTKCFLDKPESIAGLQFYADLINKYEVMPTPLALANTGMGVDMMFADGNIAMFQSGIWETPALLNYPDLKWDVVMFPKGPNGLRKFGTGGSGYAILSGTKHPDEAWAVLKALAGSIGQTELAKKGLAQPAIESIAKDVWATTDLLPANKAMLNDAVQHVVYDPFHEKWGEAKAKYIIPQFELLFNGKQDAATSVGNFIDDVNAVLAEK